MPSNPALLVLIAGLLLAGCANSVAMKGDAALSASRDTALEAASAPAVNDPLAPPGNELEPGAETNTVSIGHDKGGVLVHYAMQRAKWKAAGTELRFEGRCASACTLYLALPPEKLCVSRNAVFLFHLPSSPEREARRQAKDILLASYPDWVITWIDEHGGLSRNFLRMDYGYASRFLKTCDSGIQLASAD